MDKKFKKVIDRYRLDYILLFIIMSFYYGSIQWNKIVGDPDGFYHAKIAKWLSEGRLIQELPWMQFSTLKDSFTDHHLLYHLLLTPFVTIFDPLIGVKISAVVFATSLVLVFYWLLKKFNIPWPFLFASAFLLLSGLNFRISLIKANSLSIIMILLIIYSLFKQKYYLSMLLAWLFVWLYGGWPIAILILLVYILSYYIHKKINENKFKVFFHQSIEFISPFKRKHKLLKTSLFLLIGLALGVIINPYWPQNLYFYYQQFLQIGVVNMGHQFTVGGEWYGTTIQQIISAAPHIFIAACLAFLILFYNIKKISHFSWFNFFMAFGFLILTMKSRRYVEYYMPFILLFLASASLDIKQIIDYKKWEKIWKKLHSKMRIFLLLVSTILLILMVALAYKNVLGVKLDNRHPMNKFQAASTWLKQNTEKNSIVFHSDWDEWPILFYHTDNNYYIIGLDPTFMENYNSDLHKLYREITSGEIKYNVSQLIKNKFGAQYIFIEKEGHQSLMSNLISEQGVKAVYNDEETIIYQIIK